MNKRFIVAGNWKMNLGLKASMDLASTIKLGLPSQINTEVWVAPSAHCLQQVVNLVKDSKIKVGSQNVHWAESGAFTGELSVAMLKECGLSFAIVGHSERRHILGENNEQVVKRALSVLRQDFTLILCVGETLTERDQGLTNQVLQDQLVPVISQLDNIYAKNLVIAYEPVWAIGTGKVATISQINDAHSFIRSLFQATTFASSSTPILYGGSVTPDNFADIAKLDAVNGALVGGASLEANKFLKLIAYPS